METHAFFARAAQGRETPASLLQADAEGLAQAFHVIAIGAGAVEKGVIGHQHRGGEIFRQIIPAKIFGSGGQLRFPDPGIDQVGGGPAAGFARQVKAQTGQGQIIAHDQPATRSARPGLQAHGGHYRPAPISIAGARGFDLDPKAVPQHLGQAREQAHGLHSDFGAERLRPAVQVVEEIIVTFGEVADLFRRRAAVEQVVEIFAGDETQQFIDLQRELFRAVNDDAKELLTLRRRQIDIVEQDFRETADRGQQRAHGVAGGHQIGAGRQLVGQRLHILAAVAVGPIKAKERTADVGHGGHEFVQFRRRGTGAAEHGVGQGLFQIAFDAHLVARGKVPQINAKRLGKLEQQRHGQRPVVVLDHVQVAGRDAKNFSKLNLRQSTVLAEPPKARAQHWRSRHYVSPHGIPRIITLSQV